LRRDADGILKKGRYSAGVARRYCRQSDIRDNSRIAVTLARARRRLKRDFQELKQELELNHFQGRPVAAFTRVICRSSIQAPEIAWRRILC
jgi:SRSO17 transposase